MSSFIKFYAVDLKSAKKFNKSAEKFDDYETQLYEKYKERFDAELTRVEAEMLEVFEGRRRFSSVKDEAPLHKVVTPAEFDKWFQMKSDLNVHRAFAGLIELPQLETNGTDVWWFSQWLLNRHRKNLVKTKVGKKSVLRPNGDVWTFYLTKSDLADLENCLTNVLVVDSPHKVFPIYKDLVFCENRTNNPYDGDDIYQRASRFLKCLRFTRNFCLRPGASTIMVQIYP